MEKAQSTSTAAKPLRSDGLEARNRLLDAALTLFADKGFAKTSTRCCASLSSHSSQANKPAHEGLVHALCGHLGLKQPDDDVRFHPLFSY